MANEAMWRRPKADDDEEDLLRQQKEFLNAKQQPSVKLINLKDSVSASGSVPSANKTRSRFSSLKQSRAMRDVSTSQGSGEVINPVIKDKIQETTKGKLEDMVQNTPIASSNIILGNIMERKFDIKKYEFNDNCVLATIEQGFPQVFGSNDASLTEKVYLNETCFCFVLFLCCCTILFFFVEDRW